MTKTKNGELIKLVNAMEAAGYQVDSIEMSPEGGFYDGPVSGLVSIKASSPANAGVFKQGRKNEKDKTNCH